MAVLHGPGVRAQLPLPRLWLGGADVTRASELHHAVERVDGDVYLGRAPFVRARAQCVPDHLFEPADRCLGSSPRRVAGRLLLCHATVLGDLLQVQARWCGEKPNDGGGSTRTCGLPHRSAASIATR